MSKFWLFSFSIWPKSDTKKHSKFRYEKANLSFELKSGLKIFLVLPVPTENISEELEDILLNYRLTI